MAERQHTPFAERIDASLAFSGHLLSALVGVPVGLTQRVADAWFDAVREQCDRGFVIVFGTCVVGRPDPLLLEVADHARHVRAVGLDVDDEIDPDRARGIHELLEAPRLFERVIDALDGAPGTDRVVGWPTIDAALATALDRERDPICAVVDVTMAIEIVVGIWARVIRIGDAAVIDTRPNARTVSRRTAA